MDIRTLSLTDSLSQRTHKTQFCSPHRGPSAFAADDISAAESDLSAANINTAVCPCYGNVSCVTNATHYIILYYILLYYIKLY